MYPMNWLIVFSTALIPMVVGFIWYHPKVLGTAWAAASGTTEEKMKNSNMLRIFGLLLLFSVMLAIPVCTMVIHQMHVYSMMMGDAQALSTPGSEIHTMVEGMMSKYGQNFRTFKHGALHGAIGTVFFVMPVLGTITLFERRGAKYLFIHLGYWMICLILMGGIISAFA